MENEQPEETKTHSLRGRDATRPIQISHWGWVDILWRMWTNVRDERVLLISAGVTFYLILAIFPALAAFVSLYGFLSVPGKISEQLAYLQGIVPAGGLELMQVQLQALASQDQQTLSFGFLIAIIAALWTANNGIKTLFEAINIAYREKEKRSFVRLNLLALMFTLGAMLIATAMIIAVGVIPTILALFNLGSFSETILNWARWPVMLLLVACSISVLYRFGPSRRPAKWKWINWGGMLATVVWIIASASFSYYLQNFANYNATYGSLGAVIGFMLWIWISTIILIVGASLNAEMEHQTRKDSTIGEPKPMGERGAVVADTLGKTISER